MSHRRKPSSRWTMPRLSLPPSARHLLGALALSISAAASRIQSAQVTVTVNASGMAVTIAVAASPWHTLKVVNVRTASGPFDLSRPCNGSIGGCSVSCGGITIGPFSTVGLSVTFFTPSMGSGAFGISCVDVQLGPR